MNENMLPVGTLLNKGAYRIEKQIGSGGFGNTYVVRQVKSGTIFAMKEFFMKEINLRDGDEVTVSIPGKKSTFEAQRNKFRKEAKRLRRLQNKHIVKVHEQFEENSTAYYIMDFINGHSLADIVTQDGPIDESKAMNIFLQVLDALSVVHRQIVDDNGKKTKMLHLDIKPANIMLDKTGNAFLLDFGSSKQIDLEGGLTTDGSGFTLSKGYAPSELLDGNKNRIGPWTDLYEFGATLYHILTGMQPPSVSEITDDGSNAFNFPETISENIQQLVLWLMTPSRAKRPQSVAEIQTWLEEHDIVMPDPEPEPEPEPEPKGIKENDDETVFQDQQTEGAEGNDDGEEDERDEGETIFGPEVPSTGPEEPGPPTTPEPEPETSEASSSNNNLLFALFGLVAVGALLFLIFGNTSSNKAQAPVEEFVDSIVEVVDSVLADSVAVDDVYWGPEAKAAINKIMQCIINGNAKELADMTEYPLGREYPLKDILDEDGMMAYFNTLFDTNIKNKLRNKTVDDWEKIGWRPYSLDFGGGYLGISEDLKLCYVSYRSAKEEALRKQLVENDMTTLPQTLREGGWKPYLCYLDIQDGSVLRIDRIGEKLRLAVFYRGNSSLQPDVLLYGKSDFQGSMVLESDIFTDGKLSYDVGVSESMQDGKNYVGVEDKTNKKEWTHEIKKCYWLDLVSSIEPEKEAKVVTNNYFKSALGTYYYTGPVDVNGLPHGNGECRFTDGRIYRGYFDHGKMEGENAYFLYDNGDTFEGSFHDNRFAKGRYTLKSDGSYFIGSFKNGQPDNGTWYDKRGNKL